MSIQELEAQLLDLNQNERQRIIQILLQSLNPPQSDSETSIVEFFRNSPLCEVADELDLTRDQSPIPDRIAL